MAPVRWRYSRRVQGPGDGRRSQCGDGGRALGGWECQGCVGCGVTRCTGLESFAKIPVCSFGIVQFKRSALHPILIDRPRRLDDLHAVLFSHKCPFFHFSIYLCSQSIIATSSSPGKFLCSSGYSPSINVTSGFQVYSMYSNCRQSWNLTVRRYLRGKVWM